MTRNRRYFLCVAIAAIPLGAARFTSAQTYPARPVTMIVPTPPGGVTDTTARILAERMHGSLGQTVVVENVPGGGFIPGNSRVARAAPDGYTIGIGQWSSHVSSPAMFLTPYDVRTDFKPVSLLPSSVLWIVARPTFPANSLQELIAWLKSNPDKATAGLPGTGSGGHISALYFQNTTGTRFQLAPYRGAAPAMQDLIAGHIDLMFAEASQMLDHVRAGRIKPYALMSDHRWFAAPDIPTVDEMGVPGLHISGAARFPRSRNRKMVADHCCRAHSAGLGEKTSTRPFRRCPPNARLIFEPLFSRCETVSKLLDRAQRQAQ
jgi:tripartite-type tricarboxylate transporter receptor subunit TctC